MKVQTGEVGGCFIHPGAGFFVPPLKVADLVAPRHPFASLFQHLALIAARKVLAEVMTGERPYAVALGQGKAFVTDQYGGTLTVFDAASYAVLGKIAVAAYPEGIAASADGRFIYVANWFDNKFMKIDAATQKIVGTVDTGDGPRAFGAFIRTK